ncbi:MAG: hypothetical protein ABI045_03485 [Flavobacteriales bacterium]
MENDIKLNRPPNSYILKEVVMDYQRITGYNVNMSKIRVEKIIKPRPWDFENLFLVFSYRNNFSKDIYNVYNFPFQSKFYRPFGK